jgi:hypothetical protein
MDSDCCNGTCGDGVTGSATCAGACNTLTNSASVISWTAVDYSFSAAAGGSIASGTYYLNSVSLDNPYAIGSQYPEPMAQLTMTVTSTSSTTGTMQIVQNEPDESTYSGNVTLTLGYTISGTTITFTVMCQGAPDQAFFLEGATLGGTSPNYTYTSSFTAYATEIEIYGSVSDSPLLFYLDMQ